MTDTKRLHRPRWRHLKASIILIVLAVALVMTDQIIAHGVENSVQVVVTGCIAIAALSRLWFAVR